MELIILAIAAVSSMVVLIVAFLLCAKKQSFTIEHDYDTSYTPTRQKNTTYRVRHVHQPVNSSFVENGRPRDEIDGKVTFLASTEAKTDVNQNKGASVGVVHEHPPRGTKQVTNPEVPPTTVTTPKGPPMEQLKAREGNEVQRSSSKRKAPLPAGGPPAVAAASPSSSLKKPAPSPHRDGSARSSKKTAPAPPSVTSSPRVQMTSTKPDSPSEHTPTIVLTQPSASPSAVDIRGSPPAPGLFVKNTSDTGSLPRNNRAASPGGGRYAKKASTLPGRQSNKRRAPVAPNVAESPPEAPPSTAPPTAPVEHSHRRDSETKGHGSEGDDKDPGRSHRRVLDRLPSLPHDKKPEQDTTTTLAGSVSVAEVSLDGEEIGTVVEDPYSTIKNKSSVSAKIDASDPADNESLDESNDGAVEPPYQRVKTLIKNDDSTEINKPDDESGDQVDGGSAVIIEDAPSGESKNKQDKTVEPPYAKVMKRNKRNRGNVKVHFNVESQSPETKKPPTPSALVALNDGKMEDMETNDESKDDFLIPEGPDYI